MTRRSLSAKQRAAVFLAADGICHLCAGRIQPGQAWDVEHRIPLALGGADDESNLSPAHRKCHAGKSVIDAGNIARAKRRELRHIGIRKPSRFPGGRASKWKRKIDGSVVLREETT